MSDNVTYMSRAEAGSYLEGVYRFGSPKTLAKLACRGGGPPFVKFGSRRVLYRREDLDDWARSKMSAPRMSTSESHTPVRERRAIV